MKAFYLYFLLIICCTIGSQNLEGQAAMKSDQASGHHSAILDIDSDERGMLVPRMTNIERDNILSPATGLLVFSTTDNHFYFYSDGAWLKLNTTSLITDADNDTRIQVEESTDEDVIRFDIGGVERLRMSENANGLFRIEIPDNRFNIFIGEKAGLNTTTSGSLSNYNNFIGYKAGYNNTTGQKNQFIGFRAGYSNTQGSENNFIGYWAGYNNTEGEGNCFIGDQSGYNNTEGEGNCFIGDQSGYNNTIGTNNTFIGHGSGFYNTIGSNNIFMGRNSALNYSLGNENVIIGYTAGRINNPIDTNNYNIYIGRNAGNNNDLGKNNVCIGYYSGNSTVGISNITIGHNAGFGTQGDKNGNNQLFIDNSSITSTLLYGNFELNTVQVNGMLNINNRYFLPDSDGQNGLILSSNGDGSLSWKNLNTIDDLGNHIASINFQLNGKWLSRDGDNEGVNVSTTGEVGIGTDNPYHLFHVEKNVSNSYAAIIQNTNGGGYANGLVVKAGQNTQSVNNRFISFSRPDGTEIGGVRQINSSYIDFWSPSDLRLKDNIISTKYGLDNLMEVEVSDYVYKDSPNQLSTGFIAQQLYDIFPEAVAVGSNENTEVPWMVNYKKVTPLVVKAIQERQDQIKKLQLEKEQSMDKVQLLKIQLDKVQALEEILTQLKNQYLSEK